MNEGATYRYRFFYDETTSFPPSPFFKIVCRSRFGTAQPDSFFLLLFHSKCYHYYHFSRHGKDCLFVSEAMENSVRDCFLTSGRSLEKKRNISEFYPFFVHFYLIIVRTIGEWGRIRTGPFFKAPKTPGMEFLLVPIMICWQKSRIFARCEFFSPLKMNSFSDILFFPVPELFLRAIFGTFRNENR